MIEGMVSARHEAVVPLSIQGPDGWALDIEAVVDTGYQGFIALPPTMVAELALPFSHTTWMILADDTEASFAAHRATVLWDGQSREIDAHVAGATPLIGMLLLDGYSLRVDVKVGGRVVIDIAP